MKALVWLLLIWSARAGQIVRTTLRQRNGSWGFTTGYGAMPRVTSVQVLVVTEVEAWETGDLRPQDVILQASGEECTGSALQLEVAVEGLQRRTALDVVLFRETANRDPFGDVASLRHAGALAAAATYFEEFAIKIARAAGKRRKLNFLSTAICPACNGRCGTAMSRGFWGDDIHRCMRQRIGGCRHPKNPRDMAAPHIHKK